MVREEILKKLHSISNELHQIQSSVHNDQTPLRAARKAEEADFLLDQLKSMISIGDELKLIEHAHKAIVEFQAEVVNSYLPELEKKLGPGGKPLQPGKNFSYHFLSSIWVALDKLPQK